MICFIIDLLRKSSPKNVGVLKRVIVEGLGVQMALGRHPAAWDHAVSSKQADY